MHKTYSKMLCRTALLSTIFMAGSASAGGIGPMPVNLGQADTSVLLSQSGITDVYRSAIVGDVGTSPITGAILLLTCGEVSGNIYTVDTAGPQPCALNDATFLTEAVGDMGYAYDDAEGTLNQSKNISWQVAGATTLRTCAF